MISGSSQEKNGHKSDILIPVIQVQKKQEDLLYAALIQHQKSSSNTIKMEPELEEFESENISQVPCNTTKPELVVCLEKLNIIKENGEFKLSSSYKVPALERSAQMTNKVTAETDAAWNLRQEEVHIETKVRNESEDVVTEIKINQSTELTLDKWNDMVEKACIKTELDINSSSDEPSTIEAHTYQDKTIFDGSSQIAPKIESGLDELFVKSIRYNRKGDQSSRKNKDETLINKYVRARKRNLTDEPGTRKYKCDKCDFQTKRRRVLRTHFLRHDKNSEIYRCSQCNYNTVIKGHLKLHVIRHDTSETYQCSVCNYRTFVKYDLNAHMRVHNNIKINMLKCPHCDYLAKKQSYLTKHLLVHRDVNELPKYRCDQCEFVTTRKSNLRGHVTRRHQITDVFKCFHCNFQTIDKHYLKNHLLRHNTDKIYKCLHCVYRTVVKDDFRIHSKIHNIEHAKLHKCPECDYVARKRNYLTRHLLIHKDPNEVTMFKCNQCDYQTKDKRALRKHDLRLHEVSEIFKCFHCIYQSASKEYLVKHMKRHRKPDEDKMFRCRECSYKSMYKSDLRKHLRHHKDPNELEWHKCDECDFRNLYKSNVRAHKNRIHKLTDGQ